MWLRGKRALAWVVALVGCVDGDEGSECRATADCSGELECVGPSEPSGCGIPPLEACNSDADCFDGVCHAVHDSCSPDGIGSECRAPCTDGGCGDGFTCDLDRNACVASSCADPASGGWTCASYEVCEPITDPNTPIHLRTHGCASIECESDDACPSSNACVNGICQDGPGVCAVPMAIP